MWRAGDQREESVCENAGAALFVEALETYGVRHGFGNPGTTELPVLEAIGASDLEYVLALHEDIAVGLAAGYAQARRYHAHHDPDVCPVGVVNLHTALGTAHGLGNLYNASVTGAPLVVTAGNHSTGFRAREPILSGDLLAMVDQYCAWAEEVLDGRSLPMLVRRAFRTALTPPTGPVFPGLPLDVMLAETDAEPERLGAIPTGGSGDPDQVARAADLIVEADRPVLVVGDVVAAIAERVRDALDETERQARLEDVAGFKAGARERMRSLGEDDADVPPEPRRPTSSTRCARRSQTPSSSTRG